MEKLTLELRAGADAFGDGAHPTTRGVLTALSGIDPALFTPRLACDVGCGAGLLALTIARLFSCPVIASDIAASAVEATTENAVHNGVEEAITALQADGFAHPAIHSAAEVHGGFDLIVMNILAEPLLALARDAERYLAHGGVLILSGMLSWQEAAITDAYQCLGLERTGRLSSGDWVTLIWQKP